MNDSIPETPVAAEPTVAPRVTRPEAARALDVIRRVAAYGARNLETAKAVRYADLTCAPHLVVALEADLQPAEREALESVASFVARCRASTPVSDRLGTFRKIRRAMDAMSGLLGEADPELPPPRAALVPANQGDVAPPASPAPKPQPERAPPRVDPPRPSKPKPTPRGESEASGEQEPSMAFFTEDSEPAPVVVPPPSFEPPPPDPGELYPMAPAPADPAEALMAERVQKWEAHAARTRTESQPRAPVMDEIEAPVESEPQRRALRDPEGAGRPLEARGLVGPLVIEALREEDLITFADLLLCLPVRHEALPRVAESLDSLEEGTMQVIRGTVVTRFTRLSLLGRRFEVVVAEGASTLTCRWVSPVDEIFRQQFRVGSRVTLHGRVERDDVDPLHGGDNAGLGPFVLYDGELVWLDARGQGRLAVYEIPGVSDSDVRALLRWAVDEYGDMMLDPMPEEIRRNLRLLGFAEAIRRLHFPTHGTRRGRERMAFDELLLYQLGMGIRRRKTPVERGQAHVLSHKLVAQAQQIHNIVLNDEQEIAFSEIRRDLVRPRPMNRLLQGDVGAGKGAVALLTAILVAENHEQVVFLAPDTMAAEHRFLFAESILESVGIPSALVTDPSQASQLEPIRTAESLVVFSTHDMIRAWPNFRRLGLVVVEERESYGVATLADLPGKPGKPDLLVLSNAPLPTSIALTVFGDMSLSMVSAPRLLGVQTEIFDASRRRDAYARAIEELEAGRQVYVVLPLVNGQELLDMKDLARFADALRTDAFPGYRIGLFTGLMSREERQRVFDDFKHRRVHVLITTTVIEDGPVVQAATAMIVEQADRYDLIRLHRLRAHVARGFKQGHFLLVQSDDPDATGVERVELVSREQDGFRIAEHHLAQRGAPALLGNRADEMPSFRYVDPLEHRDLLVRARAEAFHILGVDPLLARPEYGDLRACLEESWQRWFPNQPIISARKPQGRNTRSNRRKRRR